MLIVFSGTDGAGKSTQISTLTQSLESSGYRTRNLWARGGYTPLMLKAKTLLLTLFGRRGNSQGFDKARSKQYVDRRANLMSRPVVARVWLAVAIVDLILLYGIYVRLLSLSGRVIICDRYVGDTRIDFERNFPGQFRRNGPLWRVLGRLAPNPDLYFVLTVPVEVSQERSQLKNEPFPDDAETLFFRYREYRESPEFNGPEVIRLDGSEPLDAVTRKMLGAVGRLPKIKISA